MKRVALWYVVTGSFAVLVGGMLSAFFAKHPSTFVMWTSAYLVLVVGVCQVFFGYAIERLIDAGGCMKSYGAFGFFNVGNVLVIIGTAAKYADAQWSMFATGAGSVSLVVAFVLLAWSIHGTTHLRLRAVTYSVLAALAVCVPIGLLLAGR